MVPFRMVRTPPAETQSALGGRRRNREARRPFRLKLAVASVRPRLEVFRVLAVRRAGELLTNGIAFSCGPL
jgi:hypothetical protein